MAHRYEDLSYSLGSTTFTGALAARDELGKRPAVAVLHGGAGLDAHAREQAARFADAGYLALACDLFGPGVAGDRARVLQAVTGLRDDPAELVRRAGAGVAAVRGHPACDGRVAVVGYCFGGLAALELARSGAELAAAVSIHGTLESRLPAPWKIRARVLACHGAADPHVPAAQVQDFIAAMGATQADWQLLVLGGAQHGFTHRAPSPIPGVGYHAAADARSFAATCRLLQESLDTTGNL